MSDPAADRIIDLYRRYAADWDARRADEPQLEKLWLDRFLSYVPETGHVLDLGCGSGRPIASYLMQRGRAVTGVDASAPLIDLCRVRFPDHEWIVADMRGLDLGRTFDGLIAWHSSFHLTAEDQRDLFAVFARHIKPGGVLMFTSGDGEGVRVGDWNGEPLYHDSLSPEAYRAELDEVGFEVLTHAARDHATGDATVWLARRAVSD